MDNQTNQPSKGSSKTGMWALVFLVMVVIAGGIYYFLSNGENTINSNSTNVVTNSTANTNTVSNSNANTNTEENGNINNTANTNEVANTNEAANTNESTNTNTVVATNDWERYESTEYGFTLQYPPSAELSVDSIFDPIVNLSIDGCILKYNGEGLGRGTSLEEIAGSSVIVGSTEYSSLRYQCESGRTCLETVRLEDNIAQIELYFPDDQTNQQCQTDLYAILRTYSKK